MSGLNWNKQRQRNTMARHGVQSLADEKTRDRLRQDANALLAAHQYPAKGKPSGIPSKTGRKSPRREKYATVAHIPDRAVPPGLVIYADGCCEPNPGLGGWGFVVYRDGVEIHAATGGEVSTTNNVMEMVAVLNALRWFADRRIIEPVRVLTDSMYVVNGCNDWRHGWKKKGWRRGVEKALANAGTWEALDRALAAVPIKLEWVKGHAGIIGNERADELSLIGREQAIEAAQAADPIRQQLAYVA